MTYNINYSLLFPGEKYYGDYMEKLLILGLIFTTIFTAGAAGTVFTSDLHFGMMGDHNSHMMDHEHGYDMHEECEDYMDEECGEHNAEDCEDDFEECQEEMDEYCLGGNYMC